MLAFRFTIPRPFRWLGLGRYEVSPRLIGVLDGPIPLVTGNELASVTSSLGKLGFTTISEEDANNVRLQKIRRNWTKYACFFLAWVVLQCFVWQFLNDQALQLLILALVNFSLISFLLCSPLLFQRVPTVNELWGNIDLLGCCKFNNNAAKTGESLAAIFPSNAFRYIKVWLLFFIFGSWLVVPFFYYESPLTFTLYLSMLPVIVAISSILNRRILNHEVSWILNDEYLLIYSNILWGPALKVSSSDVLGFVSEKKGVRIKISSRNDFLLYLDGPKDALEDAVVWTNQLLDRHKSEKEFQKLPIR